MINMFLLAGQNPEEQVPILQINIINGQTTIALIFLFIVFACVPLMLCVKPCWLSYLHRKEHRIHEHEGGDVVVVHA